MKDTFRIEDKKIYGRISGEIKGIATKATLRCLPYELNSGIINTYIEFFAQDGTVLIPGFNRSFPVPENWGTDDNVVYHYIAESLDVVIIPDLPLEIEKIEEEIKTEELPTV